MHKFNISFQNPLKFLADTITIYIYKKKFDKNQSIYIMAKYVPSLPIKKFYVFSSGKKVFHFIHISDPNTAVEKTDGGAFIEFGSTLFFLLEKPYIYWTVV